MSGRGRTSGGEPSAAVVAKIEPKGANGTVEAVIASLCDQIDRAEDKAERWRQEVLDSRAAGVLTASAARAQADMWREANARAVSAEALCAELLEALARLNVAIDDYWNVGPGERTTGGTIKAIERAQQASKSAIAKALGPSAHDTSERSDLARDEP